MTVTIYLWIFIFPISGLSAVTFKMIFLPVTCPLGAGHAILLFACFFMRHACSSASVESFGLGPFQEVAFVFGFLLCDYKISQSFLYFNMEYCINAQICICLKYRFASFVDTHYWQQSFRLIWLLCWAVCAQRVCCKIQKCIDIPGRGDYPSPAGAHWAPLRP